eukprot:Skav217225  [mRNA]  locus=scaffold143:376889:388300:- [translate_table: standard]
MPKAAGSDTPSMSLPSCVPTQVLSARQLKERLLQEIDLDELEEGLDPEERVSRDGGIKIQGQGDEGGVSMREKMKQMAKTGVGWDGSLDDAQLEQGQRLLRRMRYERKLLRYCQKKAGPSGHLEIHRKAQPNCSQEPKPEKPEKPDVPEEVVVAVVSCGSGGSRGGPTWSKPALALRRLPDCQAPKAPVPGVAKKILEKSAESGEASAASAEAAEAAEASDLSSSDVQMKYVDTFFKRLAVCPFLNSRDLSGVQGREAESELKKEAGQHALRLPSIRFRLFKFGGRVMGQEELTTQANNLKEDGTTVAGEEQAESFAQGREVEQNFFRCFQWSVEKCDWDMQRSQEIKDLRKEFHTLADRSTPKTVDGSLFALIQALKVKLGHLGGRCAKAEAVSFCSMGGQPTIKITRKILGQCQQFPCGASFQVLIPEQLAAEYAEEVPEVDESQLFVEELGHGKAAGTPETPQGSLKEPPPVDPIGEGPAEAEPKEQGDLGGPGGTPAELPTLARQSSNTGPPAAVPASPGGSPRALEGEDWQSDVVRCGGWRGVLWSRWVAQWEWAVIDQGIRYDSDLLPRFVTSGIRVTIAAACRCKLWPVEPLGDQHRMPDVTNLTSGFGLIVLLDGWLLLAILQWMLGEISLPLASTS